MHKDIMAPYNNIFLKESVFQSEKVFVLLIASISYICHTEMFQIVKLMKILDKDNANPKERKVQDRILFLLSLFLLGITSSI